MKKVLLVISHEGFQPLEYGEPKRILVRAGFEVITASNLPGTAHSAYGGDDAQVDVVLPGVKADDHDGVFFIGGPGALENLDNEESYKVIREAQEKNKYYGAICISPRILARAGVLENKKATGWNGDNELQEFFSKYNAEFVDKPVVVDEKLITASGPEAAKEFGEKIVEEMNK